MWAILWLNISLATVFVGLWVGIPLWLVLRRPDTEPAIIAAPVAGRMPKPHAGQPGHQRVGVA
jgi:hypothetical protein